MSTGRQWNHAQQTPLPSQAEISSPGKTRKHSQPRSYTNNRERKRETREPTGERCLIRRKIHCAIIIRSIAIVDSEILPHQDLVSRFQTSPVYTLPVGFFPSSGSSLSPFRLYLLCFRGKKSFLCFLPFLSFLFFPFLRLRPRPPRTELKLIHASNTDQLNGSSETS